MLKTHIIYFPRNGSNNDFDKFYEHFLYKNNNK